MVSKWPYLFLVELNQSLDYSCHNLNKIVNQFKVGHKKYSSRDYVQRINESGERKNPNKPTRNGLIIVVVEPA